MYKRQKGFLPLLAHLFGLLILVYPTFGIIIYAIPKIFGSAGLEALIYLLTSILLLVFPLSIGWLLLSLFPYIRISEDGISYMTSPITTKKMKWEEFSFLYEFRNGYGALVIDSKENRLKNMLSLHKTFGLLTGIIDPIILLTPDTVSKVRRGTPKFSKQ